MPQWWKDNAHQIADAIDTAERTSGHQILVRVGPATASVQGHLRDHDLPGAITALAALLPRQEEGDELPDIIHETD
jgi:hypothetical protein